MRYIPYVFGMLLCSILVGITPNDLRAQVTWTEVLPWKTSDPTLLEYNYRSLSITEGKNCTVVGELTDTTNHRMSVIIKRSTDGGLSWEGQESGIPYFQSIHDAHLEKVFAIDSSNIVAVGDSGLIIRTTDAGITWHRQSAKVTEPLFDVSFADDDHGIAVGGNGLVCITSDGGKSWRARPHLTSSLFHICKAFKNGCFYVFDKYYLRFFRSFDAGLTWDSIPIVDHSLKDSSWTPLTAVHFFDSLHFIVVGGHSWSANFNFYSIRTSDGGATWSQVMDSNFNYHELRSVCFADSLLGVASSVNGSIILTRDGGKTWEYDVIDSQHLYVDGIFFVGRKNLLAIYNRGFFAALMYGTLQDAGVENTPSQDVENILVRPNPASGSSVSIELPDQLEEKSSLCISDALGRQMYRISTPSGRSHCEIPLGNFPAGVYYVRLISGGKILTQKLEVAK
ncbi:MAG: T9SS type A sorting domain-containing protein [Bacteroidota bacterium]|nr:T9SS type A sorting domain-containing protein [Bacteroidota bacterium]MDP4229820.1 T9SS type A sorting domain-containing protein [Bacteroidota bacterium]MDP4235955.1 T9SS type A sorting domain-containing protein [Bacteroidota bacterium]